MKASDFLRVNSDCLQLFHCCPILSPLEVSHFQEIPSSYVSLINMLRSWTPMELFKSSLEQYCLRTLHTVSASILSNKCDEACFVRYWRKPSRPVTNEPPGHCGLLISCLHFTLLLPASAQNSVPAATSVDADSFGLAGWDLLLSSRQDSPIG